MSDSSLYKILHFFANSHYSFYLIIIILIIFVFLFIMNRRLMKISWEQNWQKYRRERSITPESSTRFYHLDAMLCRKTGKAETLKDTLIIKVLTIKDHLKYETHFVPNFLCLENLLKLSSESKYFLLMLNNQIVVIKIGQS